MNDEGSPEVGPGTGLLNRTPVSLAQGIRSAMALGEVTGLQLAEEAGLHPNTVGNYLKGRSPRVDHMRLVTAVLAKHMGVSTDQLWVEFGRLVGRTLDS
jgi:transcriptional regulator with XRE-family HTH domain